MKPLIEIAYAAAEAHKTTIYDLMSKSRQRDVVKARWAYFQAARDEGYKLAEIGKYVNRGHDTVHYALACMREEDRLAQYADS